MYSYFNTPCGFFVWYLWWAANCLLTASPVIPPAHFWGSMRRVEWYKHICDFRRWTHCCWFLWVQFQKIGKFGRACGKDFVLKMLTFVQFFSSKSLHPIHEPGLSSHLRTAAVRTAGICHWIDITLLLGNLLLGGGMYMDWEVYLIKASSYGNHWKYKRVQVKQTVVFNAMVCIFANIFNLVLSWEF